LADTVAAFRSALEVYIKADQPTDWAQTENDLGAALYELGIQRLGEEGGKLLADAVAAYRSALEVYTKADQPTAWAQTVDDLATALLALSKTSKGEEGLKLRRDAVELLRNILYYRTGDLSRFRLAPDLGGLALVKRLKH
jgi:hypothetical protein